jgi:hypothetical protein
MTLEIRDIIHLVIYLVSIAAIFTAFKARISTLENEISRIGKIIHGGSGNLNFIDLQTCKEHRDQVFTALRRSENVMDLALKRIEELNENVLEIMIHLQIRRKKE